VLNTGLFPDEDNNLKKIMDLIFLLATCHAYTKLRLHTDSTLKMQETILECHYPFVDVYHQGAPLAVVLRRAVCLMPFPSRPRFRFVQLDVLISHDSGRKKKTIIVVSGGPLSTYSRLRSATAICSHLLKAWNKFKRTPEHKWHRDTISLSGAAHAKLCAWPSAWR
jgi:hypothetical protein